MTSSDDPLDRDPFCGFAINNSHSRALGELLDFYREYLLTIANEKVSEEIGQKHSPSDFVQDTFFEAAVKFSSFEGSTSLEFREWLKRILLNNITDGCRALRLAQKRDISKEIPLNGQTLGQFEFSVAKYSTESPSAHVRQNEKSQLLMTYLENLPELERDIVRLRSLESLNFIEIGRQKNKSPDAVRKIWRRAIETLSKEMQSDESEFF